VSGAIAGQIITNAIMLGLIYSLIALGITLIFGIMKTINFAHGQLYMLGGYATFYLSVRYHVNYYLVLPISMALLFLLGAILEKTLFRHLRGQGLPSLLLSLGIAMGLEAAALLLFGPLNKGIPPPIRQIISIGGVRFSGMRVFAILVSAFLFIALSYFVTRVKIGQAMRALAQDPEAASLQGIDVNRMSWMGFAIGSSLAGAAGGLLVPIFYLQPAIGTPMLIKCFLVMVIGGLGSIPGCLVGAMILGFTESMGTFFFPGNIAPIFAFTVVIIFLLFKPQGIMGRE
jgi:branched-chain amino acid transport system permease protein